MLDTRFWSDSFIVGIDPLERYLFLYLLTNEHANISGVYELPMQVMSRETGIESEMIGKMLQRFAGRIGYVEGWVVVVNFMRYQNVRSPKVQTGIKNEIDEIPEKILQTLEKNGYHIDTVSYRIDTHTHLNLNLNLNLNSNPNLNPNILAASDAAGEESSKETDGGPDGRIGSPPLPGTVGSPREKKPSAKKSAEQETVVRVMDLFKAKTGWLPSYGNRTQRKACLELLDEKDGWTWESLVGVLDWYAANRHKAFMPDISQPWKMREKMHRIDEIIRRVNDSE